MTAGENPTDVAIVGAGVSGLAVARAVSAAGRSVRVFEARGRVGGRLQSRVLDNGGLDLGATWFWPNEERINRLNAELGLATHDQHISGDALFQNRAGQPNGPERLNGNPLDVPSGRWTLGGQSVTEALADALPDGTISLDDPVSSIHKCDEAITITSATGEHVAAHVVIALPPSLAMAALTFTPDLDRQFAQLARVTPVWMGSTAKVVAQYATAFWRVDGRSGAAFSHDGPMRELHDMSGPDGQPAALFGFAPATGLGSGPEPITESSVLAQLVALFGAEAAEPIELIIQDWSAEQWTSPPDVADHTNYQTYGHRGYTQPMFDGRLHWTSTETSPVAPGHVEGALFAAERTAAAILDPEMRNE